MHDAQLDSQATLRFETVFPSAAIPFFAVFLPTFLDSE
jgi:hypothetical protein